MRDHYLPVGEAETIRSRAPSDQPAVPETSPPRGKKGLPAEWDLSESFRHARTAISEVTRDFEALRRRARTLVKSAQRPVK
jgi:hypothetical protein